LKSPKQTCPYPKVSYPILMPPPPRTRYATQAVTMSESAVPAARGYDVINK